MALSNGTSSPQPDGIVLEPVTARFIEQLAAAGGPPIHSLTPQQARQVLAGAQAQPVPRPAANVEDQTFPVGPTGSVGVRILRPAGSIQPLKVVLYFHGGGWVLGDRETHDRLVREIAVGARAAVVFVDYDRSPEAQYPVPIEQAYAATRYVVDHAARLNLDASRLAVAGDSVGGNLAAAVTLLANDRGGPKFDSQVLFYPVTDADFENGSYTQFADGPWLTRAAMRWFWDAYLPDAAKRREPTASPLLATVEQLRGLPPALVVTAECDVLRDEGEAYARHLAHAGVRVTSVRYNGTIHDFVMLNALSDTPAARSAVAQASAYLRSTLGT
jgi:acetyl esterase